MIGQLTLHLHLPVCASLKEKRGRLKLPVSYGPGYIGPYKKEE